MPSISVLMSVYNETTADLEQSINSVLNQTFLDYEFIIIIDNPNNIDAIKLISEFSEKDKRIVIHINETNIGLAESLNKAATLAKGHYFLRTDADDICHPERFSMQYNFMENNDYDLVCTDYFLINEKGEPINKITRSYTSKEINVLLPFTNVIHHPTVIMKRSVFEQVGGYENYPCAQDYSLWLKLLKRNFSFYMIDKKLLYYRVRNESITGRNKLKQIVTIDYIKKKYKNDSLNEFVKSEYLNYLKDNDAISRHDLDEFEIDNRKVHNAVKQIKNRNMIIGISNLMVVLIKSKYYRKNLIKKIDEKVRLFLVQKNVDRSS